MSLPTPARRRSIAVLAMVAAIATLAGYGGARATDAVVRVALFGSAEKADTNLSQFPKWTAVLERYAAERALEDRPCVGACPLQRWKEFLAKLRGQDPIRQLEAVNRYANQTPYQTDMIRYGVPDFWATPAEFFGRSGDCEDYAIAKYLSLRHLGWSADSLRIVVLNDENRRELHAVLVAYHHGTAYVLDNLSPSVVEHGAIGHYRPIFSINQNAWYFHQGWSPPGSSGVASHSLGPAQPGTADRSRAADSPAAPAEALSNAPSGSQAAEAIFLREQYRTQ